MQKVVPHMKRAKVFYTPRLQTRIPALVQAQSSGAQARLTSNAADDQDATIGLHVLVFGSCSMVIPKPPTQTGVVGHGVLVAVDQNPGGSYSARTSHTVASILGVKTKLPPPNIGAVGVRRDRRAVRLSPNLEEKQGSAVKVG